MMFTGAVRFFFSFCFCIFLLTSSSFSMSPVPTPLNPCFPSRRCYCILLLWMMQSEYIFGTTGDIHLSEEKKFSPPPSVYALRCPARRLHCQVFVFLSCLRFSTPHNVTDSEACVFSTFRGGGGVFFHLPPFFFKKKKMLVQRLDIHICHAFHF